MTSYIGEYNGPTPTYGTYYKEANNGNDAFGHANLTDHTISYSVPSSKMGGYAAYFNSSGWQDAATTTCQRASFTWMCWANTSTLTGMYQGCIGLSGGSYYGWGIRGDVAGSGKTQLYYANGTSGGNMNSQLSAAAMTANVWQHIAFTISDAAKASYAFYLNGEPNGSGSLSARVSFSGTHNHTIGCFYNGSSRLYYVTGYLDDVIYLGDAVWTAADIKRYYNYSVGKYESFNDSM